MSGASPRITRRAMLGGAAAAGAAVLIRPPVGQAGYRHGGAYASPHRSRPDPYPERVFARRVGVLSGQSTAIRAGRRFALAGVQWSASASARIELRTRVDGSRWSPWALASRPGHLPDGPAPSRARFGEPIWSGAADEIQLRSSRRVAGLVLHFVARSELAAVPASGAGLAADAALASPGAFALAEPVLDAGAGQPRIIARSAWAGHQAPPEWPPSYGSVRLAFVHHTENPNGYAAADVPALLLAIFDYHRYARGYADIAYNFMIDAFGRIWEARAGGIDAPVIGAHAGGYNAVSTGVAVLGTFISSIPSGRALEAVQRLLAWKLALHGVPAQGQVDVEVNPAGALYTPFAPGAQVRLPRISGHRDGDLTDCPGDAFYARLPSLRPRIARLAGTPLKLTLTVADEKVEAGTPVPISGRLVGLPGAPAMAAAVEIQTLDAGRATRGAGRERTITTLTTDAGGFFAGSLSVKRNVTVRALHRLTPAAVSDVVTIAVAPLLTLALVSSSPPRVSGTVTPPNPRVIIDTYRVSGRRRRWLASTRVPVHQGSFAAPVPLGPARAGASVEVIARTADGGGMAAGQSLPLTLRL